MYTLILNLIRSVFIVWIHYSTQGRIKGKGLWKIQMLLLRTLLSDKKAVWKYSKDVIKL